MKSDWLKNELKDYEEYGNKVYGFYVTYEETDNITSQEWGS